MDDRELLIERLKNNDETLDDVAFDAEFANLEVIEALRGNTAVKRANIVTFGRRPRSQQLDELEKSCAIISRALNELQSLTDIGFTIFGPSGIPGIALILNNVHKDKLTSCRFSISHSEPLLSFEAIDDALSRHTSLEAFVVLDIYHGDEGDLRRINYLFPESLRALSSLRSMTFSTAYGAQDEMPTISNFSTPSTTSLQELCFHFILVDGPLGTVLAAIVSRNKNLQSVSLSYCDVAGENTQPFFEEVGRSTSLRTLEIGTLNSVAGYQVAADGLKNNNGLTKLILNASKSTPEARDDHAIGLGRFLDGIKLSNMPLAELCLHGYHFNGDIFLSEKMCDYLARARAPLRTLKLSGCTISEPSFLHICSGVEASPTLVEFDVSKVDINTLGFRQGISSLAENISLGVLRMDFHENNDLNPAEEIVDAIPKFRNGTAIKELDFHGNVCSFDQGKMLLEVIKQNYTLVDCKYEMGVSVRDQDKEYIESNINMILKLNKHGRRYLIEDRSKERGVALLRAVSDDLDCVLYHLLENPSLCSRDILEVAAP